MVVADALPAHNNSLTPTERIELGGGAHALLFGAGFKTRQVDGGREWLREYVRQPKVRAVRRLFHPIPSKANRKIISADDAEGCASDCAMGRVHFHPDFYVDGVSGLGGGDAVWLLTGGCHTVFLRSTAEVHEKTVFHAGAPSLLVHADTQHLWDTGAKTVVEVAMGNPVFRSNPSKVRAYILCGKGDSSYPLSVFEGPHKNSNMSVVTHIRNRWGGGSILPDESRGVYFLSLRRLIQSQLESCGVPTQNIEWDHNDTHSSQWHDASKGPERNGVFIGCC